MKLSQGNQPWKATYCLSHLCEILEKAELWYRRPHWWFGGVGIGVWELFEVAKNSNHDKNPWILHLKLLHFIVCKLHPNGVDLKNKECPRKRSTSATESLYPNQWPLSGVMSPAAMLYGAGDRAGRRVVPPPSWSSERSQSLSGMCLQRSTSPGSQRADISEFPSGDTMRVLLKFKLWLSPRCFRVLVPRKQQARKEEPSWPGNWQIFRKREAVASRGEGKSVFVAQTSHSCSYAQLLNWKKINLKLTKKLQFRKYTG